MPHYDEIGEFGLNELLAKRFTTPGGAVAPTVAPEMFPCLTLENDRPEWGHLKGERYYSAHVVKPAVAGEFGAAQLYLPTTARSIAVITLIQSMSNNALRWARLVGISGGLGGWAGASTFNRDTREAAIGSSCLLETVGNIAQPNNHGIQGVLTIAPYEWAEPIIIAPGGSIGIFASVVNQELRFNLSWRERSGQPGELL